MSEHCKTLSAIFPIIIKTNEENIYVLLHRRQNTGYQDGKWDIAGSGHVEEGETAQSATVRECKEEIGIDVKTDDLTFVHLSHRFSPERTYYDIYFVANSFSGEPCIMEPEKCSDLRWFNINELPDDIIECRKKAIIHYNNRVYYSEIIEC